MPITMAAQGLMNPAAGVMVARPAIRAVTPGCHIGYMDCT
jgi:hypothetical protein